MNPPTDPRLLLVFGTAADARPGDALLREGRGAEAPGVAWFTATPVHASGCACCTPRSAAALALGRLLLARARGEGLFFRRILSVTTTEHGRAAVLAALDGDPLVSGRVRGPEDGEKDVLF
jgi:hypothetical protein